MSGIYRQVKEIVDERPSDWDGLLDHTNYGAENKLELSNSDWREEILLDMKSGFFSECLEEDQST